MSRRSLRGVQSSRGAIGENHGDKMSALADLKNKPQLFYAKKAEGKWIAFCFFTFEIDETDLLND